MGSFIKDMIIQPFKEFDLIDMVMSITICAIAIILSSLLLWLLVAFSDSSFLSEKKGDGVIVDKHYTPAHTVTARVLIGKILVPRTSRVGDKYEIKIKIDSLFGTVAIFESDWCLMKSGDKITCKYANGRICNTLYIKSIFK